MKLLLNPQYHNKKDIMNHLETIIWLFILSKSSLVRVEFFVNPSAIELAPKAPITFDKKKVYSPLSKKNIKLLSNPNALRVEFFFNASPIEYAPESPILLSLTKTSFDSEQINK